MVGYSDTFPEMFVQTGNVWQFRYNIQEVEKPSELEGEPQKQYEYDFVEVTAIDRGKLIDALVTARFDYPAQIGKAASTDEAERAEYAVFVQSCKNIVDTALAILNDYLNYA